MHDYTTEERKRKEKKIEVQLLAVAVDEIQAIAANRIEKNEERKKGSIIIKISHALMNQFRKKQKSYF